MNTEYVIKQIITRYFKKYNEELDNCFLSTLDKPFRRYEFPKMPLNLAYNLIIPPIANYMIKFFVENHIDDLVVQEVNKTMTSIRQLKGMKRLCVEGAYEDYNNYLQEHNKQCFESIGEVVDAFLRAIFKWNYDIRISVIIAGFVEHFMIISFNWGMSTMGQSFWEQQQKKYTQWIEEPTVLQLFKLYLTNQTE